MNGKKFIRILALVLGVSVVIIIIGVVIFQYNTPSSQDNNDTLVVNPQQSNNEATNTEPIHVVNTKQSGADPEIVKEIDQLERSLSNASGATKECVHNVLSEYGGITAIRSGSRVPDDSMSTKLQLCFSNPTPSPQSSSETQEQVSTGTITTSNTEPPLLLKSIGVNLDYYNTLTGRAGDFVFSHAYTSVFDRPFMGFGFIIPAANSATRQDKVNPQPTFILPLGTKVHAIVDGVVAKVPLLYSGDYSIMVNADGNEQASWSYETEHVIHPLVKAGDRVTAGQIIAEVSDYDEWLRPGYGILEIGILHGGVTPEHLCPFAYLDPSIREDVLAKIKALENSWEEYVGDPSLYESGEIIPGCVTIDPIQG